MEHWKIQKPRIIAVKSLRDRVTTVKHRYICRLLREGAIKHMKTDCANKKTVTAVRRQNLLQEISVSLQGLEWTKVQRKNGTKANRKEARRRAGKCTS